MTEKTYKLPLEVRQRSRQWLKQYRKENPEYYEKGLVYEKNRHQELKKQLTELLGGCCAKCSIDDPRVLQFDHILGDGSKDRFRLEWGKPMFRYYLSHPEEAREKLQILCANCNWIKRAEQIKERGKQRISNQSINIGGISSPCRHRNHRYCRKKSCPCKCHIKCE